MRGVIDDLLISSIGRGEWSQNLDITFYIHRSYSWLILIGAVAIFYYARKSEQLWVMNLSMRIVFLVFLAMIAGIGMVRFDFPFWLQPLHLILAVGIFSYLFYLTLRLKLTR